MCLVQRGCCWLLGLGGTHFPPTRLPGLSRVSRRVTSARSLSENLNPVPVKTRPLMEGRGGATTVYVTVLLDVRPLSSPACTVKVCWPNVDVFSDAPLATGPEQELSVA